MGGRSVEKLFLKVVYSEQQYTRKLRAVTFVQNYVRTPLECTLRKRTALYKTL